YALPVHTLLHNYPARPSIYTLSLHDALPILSISKVIDRAFTGHLVVAAPGEAAGGGVAPGLTEALRALPEIEHAAGIRAGVAERSEEYTSELRSRENLVCRLLLEKKKQATIT